MSEFRIVSLLPAATELIYELGLGNQLVGRSHECDYPQSSRFLPVCSELAYSLSGHSGDIHKATSGLEALSIFNLDLDTLRELQPTHIVTQTQCDVCAVSKDELISKIHDLFNYEVQLIDFSPDSLTEYLRGIKMLSEHLNCSQKGRSLVQTIQKRIFRVQHKTAKAPAKPAVAIIEWMEPLIPAGHWNREFMDIANTENVFSDISEPVHFDKLIQADPEVLIIAPCGYPLKRTITELTLLESKPGWGELSAVKNGKVYLCDGKHLFNRPGSRLIDTLETMAVICHPELFPVTRRYRDYLSYSSLLEDWTTGISEQKEQGKSKKFIPGRDFYIDAKGKHVFTSYYLLSRGYCCKNACLHCPYGYSGPPRQL